MLGKADVLELAEEYIRTTSGDMEPPSIVKMRYHVKRPLPQLRLSRHSVLARDNYTCQYCGCRDRDLTIDHVHPRWMGGGNTWDNLVACCRKCNLRKGDKTLEKANMHLRRPPKRPHFIPYISLPAYQKAMKQENWLFYLPVYEAFTGTRN